MNENKYKRGVDDLAWQVVALRRQLADEKKAHMATILEMNKQMEPMRLAWYRELAGVMRLTDCVSNVELSATKGGGE